MGDEAVDKEISHLLGFTQADSINRNNYFIFSFFENKFIFMNDAFFLKHLV